MELISRGHKYKKRKQENLRKVLIRLARLLSRHSERFCWLYHFWRSNHRGRHENIQHYFNVLLCFKELWLPHHLQHIHSKQISCLRSMRGIWFSSRLWRWDSMARGLGEMTGHKNTGLLHWTAQESSLWCPNWIKIRKPWDFCTALRWQKKEFPGLKGGSINTLWLRFGQSINQHFPPRNPAGVK